MNATEGTEAKTGTNDHIVPRMYLSRFAIERPGGPQVLAASIEAPEKGFTVSTRNVAAERSFYWGSGPDGVPTHDMEAFLTGIEGEAAAAFRRILDKGKLPTDNAFPDLWPPAAETRIAIAWWVSAQLIRTAATRTSLAPSRRRPTRATPLATASRPPPRLHRPGGRSTCRPIYARPWGFGFTGLCLLTSDTPVQVLNARNDDDPLATASYWDIYVPLDPHRFLYLPGQMHASQRRLMRDHRISLNITRHRLSRAGNRRLNHALHMAALSNKRHDERGRSYYARKLAAGKGKKGALRCLKRRLPTRSTAPWWPPQSARGRARKDTRGRLRSPARLTDPQRPALRTSHFPDPPRPRLRRNSWSQQPRLDTEGSRSFCRHNSALPAGEHSTVWVC